MQAELTESRPRGAISSREVLFPAAYLEVGGSKQG